MAYKILPIPGQTTRFEDCPQLVAVGGGNTSLSLTITYHASQIAADNTILIGEITFSDVLEFRWVEDTAAYEEHPQHEGDYEFGLIEIQDSAYIEMMASRGGWRERPGTRIRDRPESEVRHFRMGFDEWGTLNVIATKVAMSSRVVPWVDPLPTSA